MRLRLSPILLLSLTACDPRPAPQTHSDKRSFQVRAATVGPESARPSLRAAYLQAAQARADLSHAARLVGSHALLDNHAQALSAEIDARGPRVRVESLETTFRLDQYGCAVLPRSAPRINGARVTLARGAVSEWYQNGPLGVEQGFDLASAPECQSRGEISLDLAIGGDLAPRLVGQRLELSDGNGRVVLRYTDLYAIDAAGRALPSRMTLDGSIVSLVIDAREARYPVRVDPLIWAQIGSAIKATPPVAGDAFGSAIAIADDTAVVGAPNNDDQDVDSGAAFVFTRGAPGAWTQQAELLVGVTPGAHLGRAVAISASGPATHRIVIGAPDDNNTGSVSWFNGSGSTWTYEDTEAPISLTGGDLFGTSVGVSNNRIIAGGPGFNSGDGYAAIYEPAALLWAEVGTFLGAVGNAERLGTSVAIDNLAVAGAPRRDMPAVDGGGYDIFLRTGAWARTQSLGSSVAGQLSGSAIAMSGTDVVVGAPGDPAGGAATIDSLSDVTGLRVTTAALNPPGLVAGDGYGSSVDVGGVLAAVGAPQRNTQAGDVFVFENIVGTWTFRPPAVTRKSLAMGDRFGSAVGVETTFGRVVVVGAPGEDTGATDSGAFYDIIERLSNGDPCTADIDCASDLCIDAVCCNTLCGRTGGFQSEPTLDCQACSIAAGGSVNGTCGIARVGLSCRPPAGVCDADELCDNAGNCPADTKLNGVECRAATAPCDAPEFCNGISNNCPNNGNRPMGFECRPVAGGCDIAEVCDGSSTGCPADVKRASGFTCRAAGGVCDVAETCDGNSAACPTDVKAATTVSCRAAAGTCDVAENCDGLANDCPNDGKKSDGTLCPEGICLSGNCGPIPDLGSLDLGRPDLAGIDFSEAPTGGIYGGGCACDLSHGTSSSDSAALVVLVFLGLLLRRKKLGGQS